MVIYAKTRAELEGKVFADPFYWINQGKIPIGTVYGAPEPYREEDIVYINFDPVDETKSFTSRALFNLLILGASGDGKSLLNKIIWYFLQKAGYKVCYIEAAKLDEASRAMRPWKSNRMPPHVEQEGIPLTHYIPSFVARTVDDAFVHNFRIYGSNLSDLVDAEYWMSLGLPRTGASVVAQIIKQLVDDGEEVTIGHIKHKADIKLELDIIFKATRISIETVLDDVEKNDLFKGKPLDLYKAWQENNSVVISYDDIAAVRFMVFDVAQLIRKASRYSVTKKMRTPMVFIFGDAATFLAGKIEFVESNMALSETKKIGRNYRSKGLGSIVEIQDMDGIDEALAKSYPRKFISPSFNPDGLARTNISAEIIKNLHPDSGRLHRDKENHQMTWQISFEDGTHVRVDPFTPNCNHFTQVYRYKEKVEL